MVLRLELYFANFFIYRSETNVSLSKKHLYKKCILTKQTAKFNFFLADQSIYPYMNNLYVITLFVTINKIYLCSWQTKIPVFGKLSRL